MNRPIYMHLYAILLLTRFAISSLAHASLDADELFQRHLESTIGNDPCVKVGPLEVIHIDQEKTVDSNTRQIEVHITCPNKLEKTKALANILLSRKVDHRFFVRVYVTDYAGQVVTREGLPLQVEDKERKMLELYQNALKGNRFFQNVSIETGLAPYPKKRHLCINLKPLLVQTKTGNPAHPKGISSEDAGTSFTEILNLRSISRGFSVIAITAEKPSGPTHFEGASHPLDVLLSDESQLELSTSFASHSRVKE